MSRSINTFELAILLAKVSRNPEELASNVDLNKLVKGINQFFATEADSANTVS